MPENQMAWVVSEFFMPKIQYMASIHPIFGNDKTFMEGTPISH